VQEESTQHGYPLAVAPDGRWLAVPGPGFGLEIRDSEALAKLASWKAHSDEIRSLSFSADGRRLLSASEDGMARQWWVATGAEAGPALAHEVGVLCARYRPSGDRIATGARDGLVHLFEPRSGTELVRLDGHRAYVHDLAWSAGGETLFSASGDGTVRRWSTRTPRELTAAREEHDRLADALRPRVDAFLAGTPTPQETAAWIAACSTSSRERQVARQLVTRAALSR